MARKRNEELNEATSLAIKDTARRLMAEQGTAALSIRGIAKALDISPPALYHYFDSLDDLITALITDAFNAFADALEIARDSQPETDVVGRLQAVLMAYRDWAVTHPVDFQLIYGNPIPGYVAPREITVPTVIRGFAVIVGLIEEVLQQGVIVPPPYNQIPPETAAALRAIIVRDGYPISELSMYLGIVGWTQLHGIIMLELFHHLGPVVVDVEAYYRAQMVNMLQTFGVKT
ncbi:MAG: TetR/AcrR family transcriptional regulator [Anaerolineae bacterium]|nr:TetR/AcrR family transcriptional regulator [Anaerolineae bacterium]